MFTGPNIPKDGLEFMIDPANEKATGGFLRDQNILDYSTWQLNGTSASGFGRNGKSSENIIISGTGPFGETTLIWEARPDGGGGADGGWVSGYFDIDHTKKYRFSVWVRRTVFVNGRFYLGLYGGSATSGNVGVYRSNNTTNYTNPYSYVTSDPPSTSQLPNNEWCLVVFHVWPSDSGNVARDSLSGRYTVANGKIGNVSLDFKWRTDNTRARHRTYLYYAESTEPRQQWVYPRVDLIDGTEPSIQDLLDGKSREVINLANRSNAPYLRNNLKIKRDNSFNNRRNHVIDFDGSNDYIETTLSNSAGDWIHSISFWMRLNTNQSSISSRVDPFSIGSASISRYSAMDISNNNVNWYFYGNDTRTSSNLFSANIWYNIILTYTGGGATTSTKTMYINGSKHTWGTTSGSAYGQVLNMPANATLNIGRDGGRNAAYFPGDIAMFKVYNRALTEKQALRLYNATKGRFS